MAAQQARLAGREKKKAKKRAPASPHCVVDRRGVAVACFSSYWEARKEGDRRGLAVKKKGS
jgi:hypothetical protein